MATIDERVWNTLETVRPVAFVLGGLGILTSVGLQFALADAVPAWLNTVLGLGGIWVVLIGLVGFYPLVAESDPHLAFGGAVTGGLAFLGLSIGLGWGAVLDLTNQTTIAEGPPMGQEIFMSALVLTLASLLLYGIASTRTHTPSRTVGVLLLLPFAAFFLLILIFLGSNASGIEPPDQLPGVLFGIAAIGLIAVGALPRAIDAP